MYFPKQFDLGLARELARLVETAYGQFAAYEQGAPWRLPDEYRLLTEIKLPRKTAVGSDTIIESILKKTPLRLDAAQGDIPIGFIAQRGKRVFIIFRGTQTAAEWISNLKIRLSAFFIAGHGSVHDGFQNSYLEIRQQIMDTIKTVDRKCVFFVAGHSLGAALASFASCDAELCEHRRIRSVYTFGSPRIGDKDFAAAFNSIFAGRSFRIQNSSDIVTEIPFPAAFLGFLGSYFSHTDTPVLFNVQTENIEKNHAMSTYAASLADVKPGLMEKLFGFLRGN